MRKSKRGQTLITAMNEALARLRRDKLKVSQPIFASYLGISPGALKAWEQGSKKPSGAARRLLQVVTNDPKAFFEALKSDSQPKKKAG